MFWITYLCSFLFSSWISAASLKCYCLTLVSILSQTQKIYHFTNAITALILLLWRVKEALSEADDVLNECIIVEDPNA